MLQDIFVRDFTVPLFGTELAIDTTTCLSSLACERQDSVAYHSHASANTLFDLARAHLINLI